MAWKLKLAPSQSGRLAIVTGANIGLGFETARALAGKGCAVVLACRDMGKADAAKAKLLKEFPTATLECMSLDLGRLKSVRAFAEQVIRRHRRLDLLINNAGIMMPPFALSEDGFESQLAANYLGHFALTGLLLPLLVATPESRVVSLSSLAHRWGTIRLDDMHFRNGYDARAAYGQSKLACLMFSYELQRRLVKAGHKTIAVAAHPGVSYTNLFTNFPLMNGVLAPLVGLFLHSPERGALPSLYAALGDDLVGGEYCGPKGFREMRGDPITVRSSRVSRDELVAAKLWSMSEAMTGISYLPGSSA